MEITVGELKRDLSLYADDYIITFGGLDFYRVKQRGDKLLQIEFNQNVYLDSKGKVVVQNLE